MNTHYVAMQINGSIVPSSAIACGPLAKCKAVAKRQNNPKDKHPSVSFVVLPCEQ